MSSEAAPGAGSSCPDIESLALFVDGEAAPALRARLERHVDECPTCLHLLADLGRHEADDDDDDDDDDRTVSPSEDSGWDLERFVMLEVVGRGASGVVHAAYDRQLDRKVAIKLLHLDASMVLDARERMLREARALGRIAHPNVVPVHEVGELDGQVHVVMEFVRGQSLRAWVAARDRPWRELLQVFVQAGRGLAAAHEVGVVHRDFKPENVLVGDDGRVRVVDFGLARTADSSQVDTSADSGATASADLEPMHEFRTETGALVGTPAYMAPEQWSGHPLDGAADQFAWCVALHEALYGERPFDGRTVSELSRAVQGGRVRPPPKGSGVPATIRQVLLRGLRTEPADRWPSMDALLDELHRRTTPRRRWWLAAGLGLLGAGVLGGLYVGTEDPCGGARAQLDGIWDEPRRQQLEAAMLGTGLSYAPETWERVERGLEDYADAWVEGHTEICEATSVRKEQSSEVMDLRMACMRRRRVALDEAVGVLAEANEARVREAVKLTSSLPRLERCDDASALRAEQPPPDDPAVAERVEAQQQRLERARSLTLAGEFDEGLEEARAALEQAETIDHPPLLAEALDAVGRLRQHKGQFEEAVPVLERAYRLSLEHRLLERGASAAAQLTFIVGVDQSEPERGLWWGQTALALGRAVRDDPRPQINALTSLGSVLRQKGAYDEALDRLRTALELEERAFGSDHHWVGNTLNNIGVVLGEQGRHQEALEHSERAVEIMARALGQEHPKVANSIHSVGVSLFYLEQLDQSREHLERARAIWERAVGPRHPDVARASGNLGLVLQTQGKLEEALAQYERVVEIKRASLGAAHPDVALTLNNMGNVLRSLGRPAEALERFERAQAIFEQSLGPRHVKVSYAVLNKGHILWERGELDEAATAYALARSIREEALGPRHALVAFAVLGQAEVARARGDGAEARRHAEHAVSLLEDGQVRTAELAEARFVLARALWLDPEQRARARDVARQAYEDYASRGELTAEPAAEVREWLETHR